MASRTLRDVSAGPGDPRAVRLAPATLGLVALVLLAGCQGGGFEPASSETPPVTPAAVPADPATATQGTDSEAGGDERWLEQPPFLDSRDGVVLRNDRNTTFVVELYVDPGGTDAVDVRFANGTTARLARSADGVTGVNGSYGPFDPAALTGAATVVRPADADAVILPLTVRPGETVRGQLPPLGPSDTVLYTVRTYPTRPGRPNPVRWVDVLGCPTGYLGLSGTIEFDFSSARDGGLAVERECTAPP